MSNSNCPAFASLYAISCYVWSCYNKSSVSMWLIMLITLTEMLAKSNNRQLSKMRRLDTLQWCHPSITPHVITKAHRLVVYAENKESINALHYWSFVRRNHWDPWFTSQSASNTPTVSMSRHLMLHLGSYCRGCRRMNIEQSSWTLYSSTIT